MTVTSVSELTKIAEGREAEIFAWEPGVVLKLFRAGPYATPSRDTELAAMSAVAGAAGPIPKALGTVEVEGRPGLLMERVDGVDMLTRIGKRPWTVIGAGVEMAEVHAAVHAAKASEQLGTLHGRLERQMRVVATQRPDLAERGTRALATLPQGDRLLHGDFHPANIILSRRGPIVIDWPNAARGDPAADVARTLLILRVSGLPPGASAVLRTLETIGRRILISRATATYRKSSLLDMQMVDRWTIPVAIARLTEGIDEERPRIAELLGVSLTPPA
jgi:aminoglycoside phosphotransferase (APT) family kinase protein